MENSNSRLVKLVLNEKLSRRLMLFAGILSMLIVIYPIVTGDDYYQKLEYKVYDYLVSSLPDTEPSPLIAVVNIDNKSLQELGQWPWPRYRFAALLKEIASSNAAAVGIDVIFPPEEDRTSIKNLLKLYKDDFDLDLEINNLPERFDDNDGIWLRFCPVVHLSFQIILFLIPRDSTKSSRILSLYP